MLTLEIKVCIRELKEVDHFKYLGRELMRDDYYTWEIKMKLPWPRKHLTKKYHS